MTSTPAQVKCIIRRGLRNLIDPELTRNQKNEIWASFNSQCAYCGTALNQKLREGHIDHLVSESAGGKNCAFNRVLACAPCNGNEKRETDWKEFLKSKCSNEEVFQTRLQKIMAWQFSNPASKSIEPEIENIVREEIEQLTIAFDKACSRIKSARIK
jgi:CRISPR/Cas system Type II protein with McrA/HNH and RuvC-like nuclease domain